MRRALAIVLLGAFVSGAAAQQAGPANPAAPSVSAPSILTVDLERLFAQSDFGARVSREFAEGQAALATENRRIADGLREEELALAAARPDMDPTVFQTEAEAFDEKAQGIRRAQDSKERALESLLSDGRDEFFDAVGPILQQVAIERGASAILDRRAVLVSIEGTDITDDAIARINAGIGDGATPEN